MDEIESHSRLVEDNPADVIFDKVFHASPCRNSLSILRRSISWM